MATHGDAHEQIRHLFGDDRAVATVDRRGPSLKVSAAGAVACLVVLLLVLAL